MRKYNPSATVLSSRHVHVPSDTTGVVIMLVETVRDDDGEVYEVDHWVQSETGEIVRSVARLV